MWDTLIFFHTFTNYGACVIFNSNNFFVKNSQRTWRNEMMVDVEKFPALIYKLFTLIFLGCAIDLVEIFFSYKIFKL